MKTSVVIASFNESDKLKDCLSSLKDFASEIIIFNMSRLDKNLNGVAKKFGARVIDIKHFPYVELIRNQMVDVAAGEWIMMLDPDERLSTKLKEELLKISRNTRYAAVNIPRKNIIFGKWISHTNWWPDKQIRFFQKGKVSWTKDIHLYPKVKGEICEVFTKEKLAIIHFPYDTVSEFQERQNRYSNYEAQNHVDNKKKPSIINLIWWPSRIFLAKYIKHKGFLDGWRGFILTYLLMVYKISVWVKIWEKTNK